MTARVLEQIRQEHRNMDRVLRALLAAVESFDDTAPPTREIEFVHSILYYIRVFPDRLHHPKEEDYLFRALRRRAPEAGEIIARLEHEHRDGTARLDDLYRSLVDYERDPAAGHQVLQQRVRDYVAFERAHMRCEEDELLPMAQASLKDEDWFRIDDAFQRSRDPLFQEDISLAFRTLYDRIVARS
jgi:branched-chain amino acid transport system ATP-binding protein